jgi:hypothetical protein
MHDTAPQQIAKGLLAIWLCWPFSVAAATPRPWIRPDKNKNKSK